MTAADKQLINILNHAARSAIMNQRLYSKVQFDNAKDATELLTAADESYELLLSVVLHRVEPRVDELVQRRLENMIEKGTLILRTSGGKSYEIKELA